MTSNFISVETIKEKIIPIFEEYPVSKANRLASFFIVNIFPPRE